MSRINPYTEPTVSPVRDQATWERNVGAKPASRHRDPMDSVGYDPKYGWESLGHVYPVKTMRESYRGNFAHIHPYGNNLDSEIAKAQAYNTRSIPEGERRDLSRAFSTLSGKGITTATIPETDHRSINYEDQSDPRVQALYRWVEANPGVTNYSEEQIADIRNYQNWAAHYGDARSYSDFQNYKPEEMSAEESYYRRLSDRSEKGKQFIPLDYNRLKSDIPVFDADDRAGAHAGGDYPYLLVNQEPTLQSEPREGDGWWHPWFDLTTDSHGFRKDPAANENLSPYQVLLHEMRHDAASHELNRTGDNFYDLLSPEARPKNRLAPLLNDPGNFDGLDEWETETAQRVLEGMVGHGLNQSEQLGWATGLQRELFKSRGSRAETPEEARQILESLIDDESAFLQHTPIENKEVLRGVRHLRRLRDMLPRIQDPVKRAEAARWYEAQLQILSRTMPALVRNDTPGQANPFTAAPRERSSGLGNSGNRWGAIT